MSFVKHSGPERWRLAGWPGGVLASAVTSQMLGVWRVGGGDATKPAGEDASAPAAIDG